MALHRGEGLPPIRYRLQISATVKSDAGNGHLSKKRSPHHFTNAFHSPTYLFDVNPATCAIAECCTLAAMATFTRSSRLTSHDAQPDDVTLFLPMQRIAPAACATTALKVTISLREDPTTTPFDLREINPDGHNMPVGGQDRATRCRPSNEEVRITPRKPHPSHHILRQMSSVMDDQVPPGGGLPQKNQHGCDRLLFP